MNQTKIREELFNDLMGKVSDSISEVFPNFDNNVEPETWSLLVLAVEEIVQQLEGNN